MSARYTPDQQRTRQIAMAIFRRRFTLRELHDVRLMMGPISEEMAAYAAESDRTVPHIAAAYPDFLVQLDADCSTVRQWHQRIARHVIAYVILEMVRLHPRFGDHSSDYWIFLGCDLRDTDVLPLTELERDSPLPDDEYVDYYGGADGLQVMIRTRTDCLYGQYLDRRTAPKMVKDALKRLAKLGIRLPA